MDPQPEADEPYRDDRHDNGRISEHPTSREGRENRRENSRAGNENDVHLGMSEEPEQMLIQNRIAPFGLIEEMGRHEAIENQRRAGDHDRRHREDHHE